MVSRITTSAPSKPPSGVLRDRHDRKPLGVALEEVEQARVPLGVVCEAAMPPMGFRGVSAAGLRLPRLAIGAKNRYNSNSSRP
jgi:hypothetical protein